MEFRNIELYNFDFSNFCGGLLFCGVIIIDPELLYFRLCEMKEFLYVQIILFKC